MSKRPRIPPKELRDIWAKVPGMKDCKGLCFDSCGPIPVSSLERGLLEERTGKELHPEGEKLTCSLLKNGLCSAYSIRPLICRIWGAVEGMPCVHGCEPERVLTAEESLELFKEIEELAGDDDNTAMREMIAHMTPTQRRLWEAKAGPQLMPMVRQMLNARQENGHGPDRD